MRVNPIKLRDAFEIFSKYTDDIAFASVNNEIYGGPDPKTVSPEDILVLGHLGWSRKDVDSCFVFNG